MTEIAQTPDRMVQAPAREATLDLVIPFTTPQLTRAALLAADRFGAGLNAAIRLLRVQVVPYPLQPDESPVALPFLKAELLKLRSSLPAKCAIIMARDFEDALKRTLTPQSVVVLAARLRPWKTRNERLAGRLMLAGHKVVLVTSREDPNA